MKGPSEQSVGPFCMLLEEWQQDFEQGSHDYWANTFDLIMLFRLRLGPGYNLKGATAPVVVDKRNHITACS
jgi:hypothetical protein